MRASSTYNHALMIRRDRGVQPVPVSYARLRVGCWTRDRPAPTNSALTHEFLRTTCWACGASGDQAAHALKNASHRISPGTFVSQRPRARVGGLLLLRDLQERNPRV